MFVPSLLELFARMKLLDGGRGDGDSFESESFCLDYLHHDVATCGEVVLAGSEVPSQLHRSPAYLTVTERFLHVV